MKRNQTAQFWRLAARLLYGVTALAALTFVCFWLGFDFASTAFAFLTLITLLSLMGSAVLSVALSILALGSLNFFFAEPVFAFKVVPDEDISGLIAFLVTSLIVTSLVSRSRKFADEAIDAQKENSGTKGSAPIRR